MLEVICSNASPLRHLGRLKERDGCLKALDLLRDMTRRVCISEQAYDELCSQVNIPKQTRIFIEDRGFVTVVQIRDTNYLERLHQKYGVGLGERSTLAIAAQLNTEDNLLANNGAEKMFSAEGMPFIELIDFLKFCKKEGTVNEEEFYKSVKGFYRPESDTGYRPKKHRGLFKELGLYKLQTG